jgi:hypothetical protein
MNSSFYLVSDWFECNGVTSYDRRSIGDVCKPPRSFLIAIGVGIISLSWSDPVAIFVNLDRRLTGDSRKAKKIQNYYKNNIS